MLTVDDINYLDAIMVILSEQGELFMDTFMYMLHNRHGFDRWVLDIFSKFDLEYAIQIITLMTEMHIEHHTTPLNP